MEAIKSTAEMIVPVSVIEEADEVTRFVGGLDMGDRRTFLAFIHGIEYKEMMDMAAAEEASRAS
jgi:hypothetical protein